LDTSSRGSSSSRHGAQPYTPKKSSGKDENKENRAPRGGSGGRSAGQNRQNQQTPQNLNRKSLSEGSRLSDTQSESDYSRYRTTAKKYTNRSLHPKDCRYSEVYSGHGRQCSASSASGMVYTETSVSESNIKYRRRK
jgi:hypothetical protein